MRPQPQPAWLRRAVAASKRARSSLSSGPDVGAGGLAAAFERPGEIGNDARASMALADMIHSEGLSGDFTKKPEVLAALQAFKNTFKTYAKPRAEAGRRPAPRRPLRTVRRLRLEPEQPVQGGLRPDRRVGRGDAAPHLAHQRAVVLLEILEYHAIKHPSSTRTDALGRVWPS